MTLWASIYSAVTTIGNNTLNAVGKRERKERVTPE